MLRASSELPRQLEFGFRTAVGRPPRAAEAALLRNAYDAFAKRYRKQPQAAEQLLAVGEHPRDKTLDASRLAAATMVASIILNLDETITKE